MTDISWSSLSEGLEAEPRNFGPITRTDMAKYQGASGDWSPPHHDEEYARKYGYEGVFSLGMLHGGFLATMTTDWLGAQNVRKFGLRFKDIGWPGDVYTCTARIVKKYQENNEQLIDLELRCTRQTGAVAAEGWATFAVA